MSATNVPPPPQAGPPPSPGPAPAPPAPKPPNPALSLAAESLLGVVGIKRFLAKKPDRVSASDEHAADALPREVRRSVSRFYEDEGGAKKVPKQAPFDYKWALNAICQDMDDARQEDIASAFRSVQPALSAQCIDTIKLFCKYLYRQLPIRTEQFVLESVNIDPSDSEVARFRRLFDVANDPMVVMRDLEVGTLIPEQVMHLGVLYPALYDLMKERFKLGFASMRARRTKWRLTYRQNRLLCILYAVDTLPASFVSTLQDNFELAEDKKNAGPPQNAPNKLAKAFQTGPQAMAEGKAE